MKNNLLIFLGEYNGYINANKRIAITVERELRKLGYTSFFACVNYFQREIREVDTDGIRIRVFPANAENADDIKKYNEYKESIGAKKCLLKHPFLTIKNQLIKGNLRKDLVSGVKDMLIEKECESILCFYYPFAPSYDLIVSDIKCRKYVYQLDPWGFHEDISDKVRIRRRKNELEMFEECDAVFTTPILKRQYLSDNEYSKYADKYVSLNFPNVRKHDDSAQNVISFDDNCFNIVFLGIVDDSYRNPEKIIRFILQSNLNIKLYFIGKNNSVTVKKYADRYPDKIIMHSPVESYVADSIMNDERVILLNIGNTYANQLPSKVLDYISSGNPVINVVKHSEDYSLQVFEKYDNCFEFPEYIDNDINRFNKFLVKCRGNKIPFERIENLYMEYTPRYVAEKLADRLEDNG